MSDRIYWINERRMPLLLIPGGKSDRIAIKAQLVTPITHTKWQERWDLLKQGAKRDPYYAYQSAGAKGYADSRDDV